MYGFCRGAEVVAPYDWCTAVGFLQNPTALGRAWKPAPTGLGFTIEFLQNPTVRGLSGRRGRRPLRLVHRRWFFAESDCARAGVETRPYGIGFTIEFLQNPTVLGLSGRRGRRPLRLVHRRWFFAESDCARAIRESPLRDWGSPLSFCRVRLRAGCRGAEVVAPYDWCTPLVFCRIRPRSGGRGNPPLRDWGLPLSFCRIRLRSGCRGAEVVAPYDWCTAVGFLQNPTVRGRFVNRPYGCREQPRCCSENFIRLRRARNARPYGVRFAVGLCEIQLRSGDS